MKTNLILISTLTFLLLLIFCETGFTQTTTADYYNVKAGNGKGLRLWSSNSYKISLGNYSHHKYGPVTDYSIKTTMNNSPNRGWTWGVLNQTPVAALNTQGNFQIKGWMKNISRQYYFGDVQRLSGDNGSALNWRSNNSSTTQMLFLDKENKLYGVIQGAGNGNFFGLRDGDNNWSILAERDKRTSFYINNSEKMRISLSGLVNINTNRDASGTPGTGALEIDGKLRLDGNEIITNSNTGLYLQDNNNGDLRIDGGTLKVDASANRVGIGTNTPDYKLDVKKKYACKQDGVITYSFLNTTYHL